MGIVTGSGGVITTASIKEEYDSIPPGDEIIIIDGEWKIVGHDDISASGEKAVTIRSQSGKNNCELSTGPGSPPTDYLLFRRSNLVRITGFAGRNSNPKGGAAHLVRFGDSFDCSNKNLRLDNCDLLKYGYTGYNASGPITCKGDYHGVIDSNDIDNEPTINGWGYGVQCDGDNIWRTDVTPYLGLSGIGRNLYLEDNRVKHVRHFAAINRGGHIVERYNEISLGVIEAQIEAHAGFSTTSVGTIFVDAYKNKIEPCISSSGKAMAFRGGVLILIHENECYGGQCYRHLVQVNMTNQTPWAEAIKYKVHRMYVWDNVGDFTNLVAIWEPNDGRPPVAEHVRMGYEIKLEAMPGYEYAPYPHPLRNVTPVPPLKKGDINEDGKVNTADITALEKLIAEGE